MLLDSASMGPFALGVVTCLWLTLNGAEGQCTAPASKEGVVFPNIFANGACTYSVELTLSSAKETVYMTEYFNRTLKRDRYDMKYNGTDWKMIIYRDTSELFSVRGHTCDTYNVTDLQNNSEDKKRLWPKEWLVSDDYQLFFGPGVWSDIFRDGGEGLKRLGLNEAKVKVRGVETNHWIYCHEDGKRSDIYITDPVTDAALGLVNEGVPVRVIGYEQDGKTVVHYSDFLGFQRVLPPQPELFEIPTQVGCKRLNPDLKQMPTYDGDLYYEAEVVYTAPDNVIYVSIVTVVVQHWIPLVSIQMTPWTRSGQEQTAPGDSTLKIYDVKYKYLYEIDKTTDQCNVSKIKTAEPTLDFPGGAKLNLLDSDIFITGTPSTDFHYLGESETRGIRTSVFEKTLTDDDGIGIAISTRYHLADEVTANVDHAETRSPVKIAFLDILSTSSREKSFTGKVEVNIFSFKPYLTQKHQLFDVSLCFPDDTKSQWYQFVFSLGKHSALDVMAKIPFIEEDFFQLLDGGVDFVQDSISRYPVVKVDVDVDNIYVTGRVLDRPSLLLKYKSAGATALDPNSATRRGMLTLENCAKACFEQGNCKRFSYCGAMCDTETEAKKASTVQKDNCTLYEDDAVEDNLPTMDQLIHKMAASLEPPTSLSLTVPDSKSMPVSYQATKFKYGTGFGLGKLGDTENKDLLDDRLSVFKYGFKFDPSEADESGRNILQKSLYFCQKACLLGSNCMSLSYCRLSQTCFLSTKHPGDMPANHFTEDTQCIIYHRSFLQYFNKYPGLLISKTAEKSLNLDLEACAHQCIQDPVNCRSFDHCPQENVAKCLLHKVHLVDSKETDVEQNHVCGHYSRTYVMDYEKKWHEELTDGDAVPISDVTAEACAAICSGDASCRGFNHCVNYASMSAVCNIHTSTSTTTTKESATCTAYIKQ